MAATFQLAQTPLPGDLPFHNYTGADIAAGLVVVVDAANAYPTGLDGDAARLPTLNQSPVPMGVGVTMETFPNGNNARVRTQGVVTCIANGTINPDEQVKVSVDSGKLGWVKTAPAGGAIPTFGQALGLATDGQTIRVLIAKSFNS